MLLRPRLEVPAVPVQAGGSRSIQDMRMIGRVCLASALVAAAAGIGGACLAGVEFRVCFEVIFTNVLGLKKGRLRSPWWSGEVTKRAPQRVGNFQVTGADGHKPKKASPAARPQKKVLLPRRPLESPQQRSSNLARSRRLNPQVIVRIAEPQHPISPSDRGSLGAFTTSVSRAPS